MAKRQPLYPHIPKSRRGKTNKPATTGVARSDVKAAMSQLERSVSDLLNTKDEIRGFADKPTTPETRKRLGELHEQARKTQSEVDELFGTARSLVYLYY